MVAYEKYLREGKGKTDVTQLFEHAEPFAALINDMCVNIPYDKVVCLEASGFNLGAAMQQSKGKGLYSYGEKENFPVQQNTQRA